MSLLLKQRKESEDLAAAELQREVEDLKLRLQMAAEHYKEKYKECQRLQKQVVKLSEQQGVSKHTSVQSNALFWSWKLLPAELAEFIRQFFLKKKLATNLVCFWTDVSNCPALDTAVQLTLQLQGEVR